MKGGGKKGTTVEAGGAGATEARGGKGRTRLDHGRGGMDETEVLSAVCKYFCDGHTPSQIAALMAEKHHIVDMKRPEPYQILSRAARLRRLHFSAPTEFVLKDRIRDRCPWLHDVDVVHTGVFTPIADHVALMLSRVLQRRAAEGQDEVHVGLAGGHALRKVCRAFARLLRQRPPGLPKRLVFHAMAAGFDVEDPMTAPTTFSAYFAEDEDVEMPVETRFVGLYAPTLVEADEIERVRSLKGIEESFSRASDLDVIVTSASLWSDEHSLLRTYLEAKSPASLQALRKRGCIGDILWRPLSKQGPIEIKEEKMKAMTVMGLSQFPEFIKKGNQVLLVLGPCGECHTPKTDMLEAVLAMKPSLITHLVTDSRAARDVLDRA